MADVTLAEVQSSEVFSCREAQRSQNMGSSWLLEGTIVGLQALSQDGQTSPAQAAGARRAVQATIRDAQEILSRAFNDRCTACSPSF